MMDKRKLIDLYKTESSNAFHIIPTSKIIEFVDKDIEALQEKVAKKLGYKLVDHKLELYGLKIKK